MKKIVISFEQYLEDKFMKSDGAMILDDDLPEAFDTWLQNRDVYDIIKYGDEYGELRDMLASK